MQGIELTTSCHEKKERERERERDNDRGQEATWHNLKNLWQILVGVLVFGKILILNWQKLWYWANFHCCRWPIYFEIMQPSGHTAGGLPRYRRVQKDKETTEEDDNYRR